MASFRAMCGSRRFGLLLALALVMPFGGCVVAAAAALGVAAYGAVSYHENEAQIDLQTSLPQAFDAVLQSLRALGEKVSDDLRPGATEGQIEVGDYRVRVERHPEHVTRIRVRVGTFKADDNRRRAALLLEAVSKRT